MSKTLVGILEGVAVIAATVVTGPIGGAVASLAVSALNATLLKPRTDKPNSTETNVEIANPKLSRTIRKLARLPVFSFLSRRLLPDLMVMC